MWQATFTDHDLPNWVVMVGTFLSAFLTGIAARRGWL